jgi:cellulose synthase/poly-beta-1,6-N-acetylglucosamine synthase-like glycosyltransferase
MKPLVNTASKLGLAAIILTTQAGASEGTAAVGSGASMLSLAGLFFLALGAAGLAGATVASPWLALMLATITGKRTGAVSAADLTSPVTLQILVAAHNEESTIRQTLEALEASAIRASRSSSLKVSITVGCDHCTDATVAKVEEFAAKSSIEVKAFVNSGSQGSKWALLNLLARSSQADWVALVDAGSIWNVDLLASLGAELRDETVMGVAPSYLPRNGGKLESLNWKLEQALKSVENRSGGPVSVHGASVLYRRAPLLAALKELEGTAWLNDDVAIPLTLRLRNPSSRIVYLTHPVLGGWVTDIGVRQELTVEYRRRRRMLVGNLQWLQLILVPNWNAQPVVTSVLLRRVFRMLWAYWVLFLGIGSAFLFATLAGETKHSANMILICVGMAAFAMALFASSNWVRRLTIAFISGLQLPRYWREFQKGKGAVWL